MMMKVTKMMVIVWMIGGNMYVNRSQSSSGLGKSSFFSTTNEPWQFCFLNVRLMARERFYIRIPDLLLVIGTNVRVRLTFKLPRKSFFFFFGFLSSFHFLSIFHPDSRRTYIQFETLPFRLFHEQTALAAS